MFGLSLLILSVLIIVFDVRGEIIGDNKELAEAVQSLTIDKVLCQCKPNPNTPYFIFVDGTFGIVIIR